MSSLLPSPLLRIQLFDFRFDQGCNCCYSADLFLRNCEYLFLIRQENLLGICASIVEARAKSSKKAFS